MTFGGVIASCARRLFFFECDVFRFGTGMISLPCSPLSPTGVHRPGSISVLYFQTSQNRQSWIACFPDTVARFVIAIDTALRTKALTALLAQRPRRQRQHNLLENQWRDIHLFALVEAQVEVLLVERDFGRH